MWHVLPVLLQIWLDQLACYIIFWTVMLYLCLDCNVIPMSGLQIYTYFCYTILYLLLLWLLLFLANLISDLLYLLLVWIFIPMSVISNSGFLNFTGYGIVCYIIFCAPVWVYCSILVIDVSMYPYLYLSYLDHLAYLD